MRVTKEMLEEYVHLPVTVAAKRLGLCSTTFKKACRTAGITKWPYKRGKGPLSSQPSIAPELPHVGVSTCQSATADLPSTPPEYEMLARTTSLPFSWAPFAAPALLPWNQVAVELMTIARSSSLPASLPAASSLFSPAASSPFSPASSFHFSPAFNAPLPPALSFRPLPAAKSFSPAVIVPLLSRALSFGPAIDPLLDYLDSSPDMSFISEDETLAFLSADYEDADFALDDDAKDVARTPLPPIVALLPIAPIVALLPIASLTPIAALTSELAAQPLPSVSPDADKDMDGLDDLRKMLVAHIA